jgi:hypothetical protein
VLEVLPDDVAVAVPAVLELLHVRIVALRERELSFAAQSADLQGALQCE